LERKGITIKYLTFSENKLIEKELKLRFKPKIIFSKENNDKIKRIIGQNSKVVKPGYKKKIKNEILKIKQKMKHEYIEKKVRENLKKKYLGK
jgi:ATP-dependent RNA helicase CshB